MEKYIRVEDGIYEFVDFEKTEGMRCLNHYGYRDKRGVGFLGTLSDFREYKKADNIEKLCDLFVIDFRNGSHTFYSDFNDTNKLYNGYHQMLYGAIWTEWGLKYVAKMNDKGELELL